MTRTVRSAMLALALGVAAIANTFDIFEPAPARNDASTCYRVGLTQPPYTGVTVCPPIEP